MDYAFTSLPTKAIKHDPALKKKTTSNAQEKTLAKDSALGGEIELAISLSNNGKLQQHTITNIVRLANPLSSFQYNFRTLEEHTS